MFFQVCRLRSLKLNFLIWMIHNYSILLNSPLKEQISKLIDAYYFNSVLRDNSKLMSVTVIIVIQCLLLCLLKCLKSIIVRKLKIVITKLLYIFKRIKIIELSRLNLPFLWTIILRNEFNNALPKLESLLIGRRSPSVAM